VLNERGDNTPFESATAVNGVVFYGWPVPVLTAVNATSAIAA
jgi:glucose/arabinose dehydrogenase